jgi:chaperonin GroEL
LPSSPGGGTALAKSELLLKDFSTGNPEEDVGVKIVRGAIKKPLMQIVENSGEDGKLIVRDVQSAEGAATGYNAATLEFVDMFEQGIVDPTKVTRVALQNACSIAGLMLTTECVVAFDKEENAQPPHPGAQMMM